MVRICKFCGFGRVKVLKETLYTVKNRFTRMHIGETLIALMDKMPFKKITMRKIAQSAGVSHVTLYNYYDSKESILKNYLDEIISGYLTEKNKLPKGLNFQNYEHILFSLNYFDKYAVFFRVMYESNFHNILFESINSFMEKHLKTKARSYSYGLYYYAGALLNTFLKWQLKDDREPASEVASVIYKFSRL